MSGIVAAGSTSRQLCIHGRWSLVQSVYQGVHYSSTGKIREDSQVALPASLIGYVVDHYEALLPVW